MSRNLEGLNVGFLRQVMGQKANQPRDGTWISASEARVLKEVRTQTLRI